MIDEKQKIVMINALTETGEVVEVQFQSVSTHPLMMQLNRQRDSETKNQYWDHGYQSGIIRGQIIEIEKAKK